MERNTKINLAVLILGVTLTSYLILHPILNTPEKNIPTLSNNQIDAMVRMGIIPVHPTLSENKNDINTGLSYETSYGTCKLNRDIFGRYYCKW